MARILKKLAGAVLATVAVSGVAVVPAEAANPPAVIQRGILLDSFQSGATAAYIIPTTNRRITLTRGTYDWTNEFLAAFPGTSFRNSRRIDLAAGDYDWNCFVDFVEKSSYLYDSKCYLIPDSGAWAWTERLILDVRDQTWFTWKSQLKPV